MFLRACDDMNILYISISMVLILLNSDICGCFILTKTVYTGMDIADDPPRNVELITLLRLLEQPKRSSPQRIKVNYESSGSGRQPSATDLTDLTSIKVTLEQDSMGRNLIKTKRDSAIMPPSREWCRIMGYRKCRRN